MYVPITRPWFDDDDLALLRQPLETGWVAQGPFVAEFERAMAEFTGAAHAVACTSATTGLHLALAARDIGPGDEVLVPAFTWVSTANAALFQGATPVLCDVDPHSFNVRLDELERRRTARTKAVIPVHLFGLPVDMAPLLDWARAHGLWVVEDAACGLGASLGGQHVGTFGDCGVFSFHPRKAVTTGEGGMIVCEDEALATRLRTLRAHGARGPTVPATRPTPDFLRVEYADLGFNYRLTDLQGALGVAQMRKAARIRTLRTEKAQAYTDALAHVPWLATPTAPAGMGHGWQSYVVRVRPEAFEGHDLDTLIAWRDRLMIALEAAGVSTRPGTHAVSGLALYRERLGVDPLDYPGARAAEGLSLALPLFPTLTEAEQAHVIETLPRVAAGLSIT